MTPDSQDFPRAIVPNKPGSTIERFDRLCRVFGDPLVTMFSCLQSQDPETRFKAAAELLPYRHRKLKPSEDPADRGATTAPVLVQINFQKSGDQVSLPSSVISTVNPLD
jgi:hypothetical protein